MNDDAINRYQRNAAARETAARKREHSNFTSLVVGLLLVAALAAGYVFWSEGAEGFGSLTSLAGWTELKDRAASLLLGPPTRHTPFMDEYARVATRFTQGTLSPWKAMPAEMKPKNAPAGTVYYALVPRGESFDLYSLKMGGAVEELSPFRGPVPISMTDFKSRCNHAPYYIACFDRVFLCGSDDIPTFNARRHALLPSFTRAR